MTKTGSDSQFAKRAAKVRVAIYARCATEQSTKRSLRRQQKACRSYARLLGAGRPSLFVDTAAGSSVQHRPGLFALLNKCCGGEVDILVVEDFDRLTRSATGGVEITHQLSKAGVEIHTVTERREVRALDYLIKNRFEKCGISVRKARDGAEAKKPPAKE